MNAPGKEWAEPFETGKQRRAKFQKEMKDSGRATELQSLAESNAPESNAPKNVDERYTESPEAAIAAHNDDRERKNERSSAPELMRAPGVIRGGGSRSGRKRKRKRNAKICPSCQIPSCECVTGKKRGRKPLPDGEKQIASSVRYDPDIWAHLKGVKNRNALVNKTLRDNLGMGGDAKK